MHTEAFSLSTVSPNTAASQAAAVARDTKLNKNELL